jgi:hypothetical protein
MDGLRVEDCVAEGTPPRARRSVPEAANVPESSAPEVANEPVSEPDFDWSWMEDGSSWTAPTVDVTAPSPARVYDFLLGGKDNYAIDRETAARVKRFIPDLDILAEASRAFVVRAVTAMAEAGIEQFVDLGCGLPRTPMVHDVAGSVVPDARVVYVDHDPIVVVQVKAVIDGQPGRDVLLSDLCDPSRLLHDHRLLDVVDLGEPVGLIMASVLHHVDLSVGPHVVGHYLDRIVPGSHIAFSAAAAEGMPGAVTRELNLLSRVRGRCVSFRTRAQVEELFDGMSILDPGITDVTRWHADGEPGTVRVHSGIAVR